MLDTTTNAHPNVRSGKYFIVESRIRCDQCNVVTAVFGFAVPAGYESLCVDDDTPNDESEIWEAQGIPAVLSYVEYLSETVANRIRSMTQNYRLDRHRDVDTTFWANHCGHCGVQMEEEELHGDAGSPFVPLSDEGLEAIRLHEVREPFSAWAGVESYDMKQLHS